MTRLLAPQFWVVWAFVASAVAVHFRGKVRLGFWRQFSDHSTIMAPYNVLMYMFSAVPNRPARITISTNSTSAMARPIRDPRPKLDLEVEAVTALEEARAMPHGPERMEAMKRAGILRNAADLKGLLSPKKGRPAKT